MSPAGHTAASARQSSACCCAVAAASSCCRVPTRARYLAITPMFSCAAAAYFCCDLPPLWHTSAVADIHQGLHDDPLLHLRKAAAVVHSDAVAQEHIMFDSSWDVELLPLPSLAVF